MVDQTFAEVAARAVMVPMLPCADVDAMAEFWVALGLRVTYRQLRPNPYVALRCGGIDLHYYGMPEWDPESSHSTCAVVVADTRPVHAAFRDGLEQLLGRVPATGVPRLTRPRERANNGGLSGFSLVDPAGNWIRVSRAPDDPDVLAPTESGSTAWTSTAGSKLGRALENAVVMANSHGDPAQARKLLTGALRRATDESVPDRAQALAFLVELHQRCDDGAQARQARDELELLPVDELDEGERDAVVAARREADEALAMR